MWMWKAILRLFPVLGRLKKNLAWVPIFLNHPPPMIRPLYEKHLNPRYMTGNEKFFEWNLSLKVSELSLAAWKILLRLLLHPFFHKLSINNTLKINYFYFMSKLINIRPYSIGSKLFWITKRIYIYLKFSSFQLLFAL